MLTDNDIGKVYILCQAEYTPVWGRPFKTACVYAILGPPGSNDPNSFKVMWIEDKRPVMFLGSYVATNALTYMRLLSEGEIIYVHISEARLLEECDISTC